VLLNFQVKGACSQRFKQLALPSLPMLTTKAEAGDAEHANTGPPWDVITRSDLFASVNVRSSRQMAPRASYNHHTDTSTALSIEKSPEKVHGYLGPDFQKNLGRT